MKAPDKSSTNSYQKTDAWFVHWQSSLGIRTQFEVVLGSRTQFEVVQEVDQEVVRINLGCSCNNRPFEVLVSEVGDNFEVSLPLIY